MGQLINLYIKQTQDLSRTLSDRTFLRQCLILWPFSVLGVFAVSVFGLKNLFL